MGNETGIDHCGHPVGITKIITCCCCFLAGILFCDTYRGATGVLIKHCPELGAYVVLLFIFGIWLALDLILRSARAFNCSNNFLFKMDIVLCLLGACAVFCTTPAAAHRLDRSAARSSSITASVVFGFLAGFGFVIAYILKLLY